MVFGHKVQGPLTVLCDKWLSGEPPVNLIDYVNGFWHRLYVAGQLAKQNVEKAQAQTMLRCVVRTRPQCRTFPSCRTVLVVQV